MSDKERMIKTPIEVGDLREDQTDGHVLVTAPSGRSQYIEGGIALYLKEGEFSPNPTE